MHIYFYFITLSGLVSLYFNVGVNVVVVLIFGR